MVEIKDIALIFATSGILGVVFLFFNLPILVAYLATGVILGPLGFNIFSHSGPDTSSLIDLGVAFMLFLAGLELNTAKIKSLGCSLIAICLGQTVIITIIGFVVSLALGFSPLSSFFLGFAISFASTVVGVKLLSDKNQINSLHGKISVGILLIQDIVAISFLILINALSAKADESIQVHLWSSIASAIIFVVSAYLVRKYLIKQVFELFSTQVELLFVASIGWALGLAVIGTELGFSPAIGAFLAGVTLAPLPYAQEIRGRVRWLRDFFVILFLALITVSQKIEFNPNLVKPIIIIVIISIIIKPLINLTLMGMHGYRKRTSFITSLYLTPLSEFALILVATGLALGYIDTDIATIIVFSTIVSMAISSVLIEKSDPIYHLLSRVLSVFERKGHFNDDLSVYEEKLSNHVVVFGLDRIGQPVLKKLRKIGHSLLVVDFDPAVIKSLRQDLIPAVYGDMGDPDLISKLGLDSAKMVISTVHDFADTILILKRTNAHSRNSITFVTADNSEEALECYKQGADYVILPYHISGEFLADIISEVKDSAPKQSQKLIINRKQAHIKELEALMKAK